MTPHQKGTSFATLLSFALHGVLALLVLALPEAWLDEVTIVDAAIELEIIDDRVEAIEERAEVEPTPEDEADPDPLEPTPPDQPRPAAAIQRDVIEPSTMEPIGDAVIDPTASEGAVGAASSGVDVPNVPPDPGNTDFNSDRMRALLAPGAVARGGFVATGPGPTRTGPPAGNARGGPAHLTEAEAEARHNAHLRERAMSKAHTEREPFVIRRQADGSYRHDGHLFVGIIQPNGEVEFQAHGAVQTDGFSASGSWDMNDLIQGANGQNPRRAEEERFMRETEELRHRLEDEYRSEQLLRSRRRLRGRLRSVWGTESRSYAARRARLFHIWDELAEDGSAEGLRDAVIRFIRGNLGEGHEHGYSEAEIARLNARRDSRAEFSPY